MLNEYYENTIKGNWVTSHSIFSAFIGEQKCLNDLSKHIFGVNLFNRTFENENRPKEFTFFFTPTLKNYNEFVLLLDKLISENINKDFFNGKIDLYEHIQLGDNLIERKPKGTLSLLQEWILLKYNHPKDEIIKDLFKPLKKVRSDRQSPAHKISEDTFDKKFIDRQKVLINDVYSSLRALRTIFQQHPKARGFEIPDWLDNGDIKTY